MPEPKKDESKEEYVSRFMSSEEAKKSFPDEKQRLAVAHSKWRKSRDGSAKGKELVSPYPVVSAKLKESGEEVSEEAVDDGAMVYTFVGASTVPDRTRERLDDGTIIEGEILSKRVLEKFASMINDESRLGGDVGSYRTISLFHDRVHTGDFRREEAGYIKPNAKVLELPNLSGEYGLFVDVEVNDKYAPPPEYSDYTPDKIHYKIGKKAMGLSIEYQNTPSQERLVKTDKGLFRYIMDSDDFRGFGFANPNLIGNPTAVRVKEISDKKKTGDRSMGNEDSAADAKSKELSEKLSVAEAKIKELSEKAKLAEDIGADAKVKELSGQIAELQAKMKELRLENDEVATKIKESVMRGFDALSYPSPAKSPEESSSKAKIKEIYSAFDGKATDYVKFREMVDEHLDASVGKVKEMFARDGPGFDFEKWQTVKVKCHGSKLLVVPTAKTKDVIDASDMAEGTYNQTNAMFADRYVGSITETFLKEDSLLTAMRKEQHVGGNDQYQYRLWVDYVTVTGNSTLAVDPNVTSVARTQRKFEKMQTAIREYRDGVEVTDFTQAHSMAAVGDLLGLELERAAAAVTESLNSDLFKGKTDGTSGWLGVIGLIGVADSATHTSLYGKTRSAANRLLDSTTANTYDSTSEAISVALVREGYEKVLAQGSRLADLAIVIHPTQCRLLFDSEDAAIRYNSASSVLTMNAAPPSWGFSRSIVPHLDGIPIIRDYRCESSAAAANMFAVVDMSADKGFNLVVSKPLGARGLAKVGTSESAYVSFWGCTVYKSPRNVFVHDSLSTS